jgi:hypothetical protein
MKDQLDRHIRALLEVRGRLEFAGRVDGMPEGVGKP